ncbi:uncharacterized protein [Physcomitrium patens]|uniref:uncharacterized protein n=1 Tax=Physcomitrium patens TaxID=3218 RepID=UPI003CCCADE5
MKGSPGDCRWNGGMERPCRSAFVEFSLFGGVNGAWWKGASLSISAREILAEPRTGQPWWDGSSSSSLRASRSCLWMVPAGWTEPVERASVEQFLSLNHVVSRASAWAQSI